MSDEYQNELKNRVMLGADEMILWRGKPKRSAFILTKSLTLMPLALLWLVLDLGVLVPSLGTTDGPPIYFILPFFALHMMPVWIWLGNVLSAGTLYRHTDYYVTNRRIIIRHGVFAVNEVSLFFRDIKNTQLRIGLVDRLFSVGDVCFDTGIVISGRNSRTQQFVFEELENPQEAYARISRIVLDMQTDVEYPNAYRPPENPGYHTDYRP